MSKSTKELAFLRDLYVSGEWTAKFTDFAAENLKLPGKGKILYFNAGTGDYALLLRKKLGKKIEMICVCEDEHLEIIARAKANAVGAEIEFAAAADLPVGEFDFVLADLSLTEPDKLSETVEKLADFTEQGGEVAFFTASSGSFGEIYSYLWETFLEVDLAEKSAAVETLINRLPTVSDLEKIAEKAALTEVDSVKSRETFEYKNAADFVSSPLAADFLFPAWFDFLDKKQLKTISKQFVKLAEADLEGLSFYFSVNAALVKGKKSA